MLTGKYTSMSDSAHSSGRFGDASPISGAAYTDRYWKRETFAALQPIHDACAAHNLCATCPSPRPRPHAEGDSRRRAAQLARRHASEQGAGSRSRSFKRHANGRPQPMRGRARPTNGVFDRPARARSRHARSHPLPAARAALHAVRRSGGRKKTTFV